MHHDNQESEPLPSMPTTDRETLLYRRDLALQLYDNAASERQRWNARKMIDRIDKQLRKHPRRIK